MVDLEDVEAGVCVGLEEVDDLVGRQVVPVLPDDVLHALPPLIPMGGASPSSTRGDPQAHRLPHDEGRRFTCANRRPSHAQSVGADQASQALRY